VDDVRRLDLDDTDDTATFDALVDRTPDADPFCSTSAWITSAQRAFTPDAEPLVVARQDAAVALMTTPVGDGRVGRCALELMWGFACPVAGPSPAAGAGLLLASLARTGPPWDVCVITGVPPTSPLERELVVGAGEAFRVRAGPSMARHVADLSDGTEAFLARRSAKFRRNLRRAERQALERGIRFDPLDGDAATDTGFARIEAIERRSWKGMSGSGILTDEMRCFYREMTARLAATDDLRAIVATADGTDIGYILGGVRNGRYRGFQLSYVESWAAASVGNLLQWHQMDALAADGVTTYDLGMDMGYKRSWSDTTFVTRSLVLAPAAPRRTLPI
jgi:CelD/BcsL family acetyltransferase involved in cellulose biosynthesis